jgi:hypothetical protein
MRSIVALLARVWSAIWPSICLQRLFIDIMYFDSYAKVVKVIRVTAQRLLIIPSRTLRLALRRFVSIGVGYWLGFIDSLTLDAAQDSADIFRVPVSCEQIVVRMIELNEELRASLVTARAYQ